MPSESTTHNNIQIIPFCAPLPSQSPGECFGVVGTITLRGQSAVVWFGWGDIEACEEDENEQQAKERSVGEVVKVGSGNPPMGSLSLSMPPIKPSIPYTAPSTQLLGGSSEEDMILGQQISARLAKKVGWPIFVSCSFNGWADDSGGGAGSDGFSVGLDVSPQMAAALGEKEVGRILLRQKKQIADGA